MRDTTAFVCIHMCRCMRVHRPTGFCTAGLRQSAQQQQRLPRLQSYSRLVHDYMNDCVCEFSNEPKIILDMLWATSVLNAVLIYIAYDLIWMPLDLRILYIFATMRHSIMIVRDVCLFICSLRNQTQSPDSSKSDRKGALMAAAARHVEIARAASAGLGDHPHDISVDTLSPWHVICVVMNRRCCSFVRVPCACNDMFVAFSAMYDLLCIRGNLLKVLVPNSPCDSSRELLFDWNCSVSACVTLWAGVDRHMSAMKDIASKEAQGTDYIIRKCVPTPRRL